MFIIFKKTIDRLKEYSIQVKNYEKLVVINKVAIKNVKSSREEKQTIKKCKVLKGEWKKARRKLYERIIGSQAEEHSTFISYVQCLTTRHTLTIQVMRVKVETSKKTIESIQTAIKVFQNIVKLLTKKVSKCGAVNLKIEKFVSMIMKKIQSLKKLLNELKVRYEYYMRLLKKEEHFHVARIDKIHEHRVSFCTKYSCQ